MPRLSDVDAAAMFVETANEWSATFSAEPAEVEAVCRLLEGWPPAIELAARRAAVLSMRDLIGALEERSLSEVLDSGERTSVPTMRGAAAEGLAALDSRELDLATRLAGFVDWCTLAEITEAVADDGSLDGLLILVDHDIVDVDRDATETLFRLRRPYRELLVKRGASPGTDHLAALRRFARDAAAGLLIGAGDLAADRSHAMVARRERDLRAAAWRVLCETDEHEAEQATAAGELALALSMHAAEYGTLASDGGLLDQVIERTDGADPALSLLLQAYRLRRRFESVEPGTDTDVLAADLQALVTASSTLDRADVALECLFQSVASARTIAHFDQARTHVEQAITLSTRYDRPAALAQFELLAAMVAHVQGRFDDAGRLAARAHTRARRHDLLRLVALSALMFHQLPPGSAGVPEVRPSLHDITVLVDGLPRRRSVLGVAYGLAAQSLLERDAPTAARATAVGLRAADAIGLPAGLGLGVMLTAVLAAGGGQLRLAAHLHGAMMDHQEVVRIAVVSANRALYDHTMEAVRLRLGDRDFLQACGEGATWGWARIAQEALGFADATARPSTVERCPLTARQLEILALLAAGMSNKEISERLVVAPKTTMHHASNIYRRLGVRGRGEAVAWGRRAGLV